MKVRVRYLKKGKIYIDGEKLKSYYEDYDKITYEEDQWFEKSNNGALIYCEEGVYKGYGYDFSSFYPFILVREDFLVPTKEGESKMLKKTTKNGQIVI
jgi:hypothetical protein